MRVVLHQRQVSGNKGLHLVEAYSGNARDDDDGEEFDDDDDDYTPEVLRSCRSTTFRCRRSLRAAADVHPGRLSATGEVEAEERHTGRVRNPGRVRQGPVTDQRGAQIVDGRAI